MGAVHTPANIVEIKQKDTKMMQPSMIEKMKAIKTVNPLTLWRDSNYK